MLDDLLQLAIQIGPQLQIFLTSYIPDVYLRGAMIDVDEYWINAAKSDLCVKNSVLESRLARVYHAKRIDPYFRPSDWSSHSEVMGYDGAWYPSQGAEPRGYPLVIRVIVTKSDVIHVDLPRRFSDIPIVYEVRQDCRALIDL